MTADDLARVEALIVECDQHGWNGYASALRALLSERQRLTWQPISTAPKDGTRILVCVSNVPRFHVARWEEIDPDDAIYGWCDDAGWSDPTHWMPLPAPPTERTT